MNERFMTCGILFLAATFLLLPHIVWSATLNIGSIGSKPSKEIKRFMPLVKYLEKELKTEGIDKVKVVVANDISKMAALLKEGKVDLYIDSPFSAVAASHLSGSKLILRRWKKGVGEYHSVFFARKDSGIDSFDDLKGKIIGFEEPFSSSAYLLPKVVMIEKGFKLTAKKGIEATVDADEVGYIFSNDNENTMIWVLRGKLLAGVMDNQSYLKEAKGKLDSLKIIYETFSIPRHVVSTRKNLPTELVENIKKILIDMDKSESGRKSLHDFEKTAKFDELPDGTMSTLLSSYKYIAAEFGMK